MKLIIIFWALSLIVLILLSIVMLCDDICDLEISPKAFKVVGLGGMFGASLSGATMLVKELLKK